MLAPLGASAQSIQTPPGLYFSGFVDRHSLGNETETASEIRPLVGSAVIGYWVRKGIGLELEAGVGLTDDSVADLDVDFNSEFAANLRLESPPRSGIAAYALFGYVRTSYDTSVNGFDSTITLPGGRIAFGLTFLLNSQLHVDAGFSHHDYDDDTRVNSFRIGMRFDLDPQEL